MSGKGRQYTRKIPKKSFTVSLSILVRSFREMPPLLKLLFILSAYSSITALLDIYRQTPVNFGYFGTAFPRSYPIVWHMFTFFINAFTVAVYLKRSFSWLKSYLYISVIILVFGALNSANVILDAPDNQRIALTIGYSTTVLVGIALYFYQLRLRQYFYRP